MANGKKGVLNCLVKMDMTSLYIYCLIFVGCGIAMLLNLNIQQVGFGAFFSGKTEERTLLLLTIVVAVVCLVGMCIFLLAILQKKDKERYSKASRRKIKR